MNPILLAAAAAAAARRRRGLEGPRRRPGEPGLVRLLLAELAWAVRTGWHPAQLAAAGAVAVGVGSVLGPSTPGPVLGAGWRLALAVVLGLAALAMVQVLLQRPREESADDLVFLVRVTVAVVAALLVAAVVLGWVLAAVTAAPAAPDATLRTGLPIDAQLLGGAALVVAAVLATALGERLAVPAALVLLGVGMLVGDDGLGLVSLQDPGLVQRIGVVALVVVLFNGGLATEPRDLRRGLGPGLALATVGVAVTAGVTALGAMALLDVPARLAWLLGSIVAATDATAVFALLRRTPLQRRTAAVLQVESGANDPVAILLTVGLLASWSTPPDQGAWVAFAALQLLGGVLVGAIVGWAGAALLRRVPLGASGLHAVLALALAGVAYGVAAVAGASGFLAAWVAGIVVAAEAPRRRAAVRSLTEGLAGGVEVGLFLLLGLLVFPSRLPDVAGVAMGVVAILLLVARPVAVAVTLAWFSRPAREMAAVSWLGVRGAVPIVLATLAFSAGIDEAGLVFHVVFFVVVASLVVQGPTAGPLVRRLGLLEDAWVGPALLQATPLDDVGLDVLEVVLPASSPLVGASLRDAPPPAGMLVVAVVRDHEVLLARGDREMLAGDRLVVATDDQRGGLAALGGWAGVWTLAGLAKRDPSRTSAGRAPAGQPPSGAASGGVGSDDR